jgi:hypothetical protein
MIDYKDLTPPEKRLVDATREGRECVLSDKRPNPDFASDPATDIRADVLMAMIDKTLINAPVEPLIQRQGIALVGARIRGTLNLDDARLKAPLRLVYCTFCNPISLNRFQALLLDFSHSLFTETLSANDIKIDGGCTLDDATAQDQISMVVAQIGGQLTMNHAELKTKGDGAAFMGQSLKAQQGVFFRNLTAIGTVNLVAAYTGGQLSMNNAKLTASGNGVAFKGQGLKAEQGAFFNELTATGTVDLNSAQIGGQLSMKKATLTATGNGVAFRGQGLSAQQGAIFNKLTATGTVALNSAQIGGQLSMNKADLTASGDGVAFRGQGLKAEQDAFFNKLTATGTVDLNSAQIGGQLSMNKATLTATGDGIAFHGQDLAVRKGVYLNNLTAKGLVSFRSSRIEAVFETDEADFQEIDDKSSVVPALSLRGAIVGELRLFALKPTCAGICDLTNTRAESLLIATDTRRWPTGLKVIAPDIRIESVPEYTRDQRKDWLRWLQEKSAWSPHLYQQMAKRLREAGHEECAKAFYIAMRRRQRREELNGLLEPRGDENYDFRVHGYIPKPRREWLRLLGWEKLLDWTVGFGHRPMNALICMAALIVIGWVGFAFAWHGGAITPAQAVVFEDIHTQLDSGDEGDLGTRDPNWAIGLEDCVKQNATVSLTFLGRSEAEAACLPADYPAFNALFYSFDLAIPLLEMRPERYWTVNVSAPGGQWVLAWYYFHIIVGSVLTGLFLAAVTGIVKRE